MSATGPLGDEEKALVEETVTFLGTTDDPEHKWAVLKIGGDDTSTLKEVADQFKPGPGDTQDYAGSLKALLDRPGENIMIAVPKDTTKVEVMDKWVRFSGTGLSGSELYGRLRVLAMARCSEKQAGKCKRCEEDGSYPFEACLTVPGQKH